MVYVTCNPSPELYKKRAGFSSSCRSEIKSEEIGKLGDYKLDWNLCDMRLLCFGVVSLLLSSAAGRFNAGAYKIVLVLKKILNIIRCLLYLRKYIIICFKKCVSL